jgi:hypothetical protein
MLLLEMINVIRNVSLDQVEEIIMKGEMVLPSVQTCFMAIRYLKSLNKESEA